MYIDHRTPALPPPPGAPPLTHGHFYTLPQLLTSTPLRAIAAVYALIATIADSPMGEDGKAVADALVARYGRPAVVRAFEVLRGMGLVDPATVSSKYLVPSALFLQALEVRFVGEWWCVMIVVYKRVWVVGWWVVLWHHAVINNIVCCVLCCCHHQPCHTLPTPSQSQWHTPNGTHRSSIFLSSSLLFLSF